MGNLFFGIKSGTIVSIEEVENGAKCECTCPCCGEKLIAKKGNIKIHHFAHESKEECEYGYETTLHILAKELFTELKYFVLPNEKIRINDYCGNYQKDKQTINIEKVELEKWEDSLKPDVIAWSNGKPYYIEIFVTHKIDEDKRQKIINKNIDTIEINLSSYKKRLNKEELRKDLEEIFTCKSDEFDDIKYWVYNTDEEKEKQEIIKNCGIEIEHHGFALHTKFCPSEDARNYHGNIYANVIDDCSYCPYFVGQNDNQSVIYCKLIENYKGKIPEENYNSIIALWESSNKTTIIIQRGTDNFFVKITKDPKPTIEKYNGKYYGYWSVNKNSWTNSEIYKPNENIWKIVWQA